MGQSKRGRTFKTGEAKKSYYERLEHYNATGTWPKAKSALSGAQKAPEAHSEVHPEEQAPAAAPHPTLFDLDIPTPPSRGTFDH
jgi:hypothetical protein